MSEETINVSILQLSYGNYVSLDDYVKLKQENKQLKEQLQQRAEDMDKSYIRVQNLLDYYEHYKVLPKSILDELIELHKELDKYKGDNNEL